MRPEKKSWMRSLFAYAQGEKKKLVLCKLFEFRETLFFDHRGAGFALRIRQTEIFVLLLTLPFVL